MGGYINNHVILERTRTPESEKPHVCKLPGFFSRRWHEMKLGAIVQCRKCEARYEWKYHGGWDIPGYRAWTRLEA